MLNRGILAGVYSITLILGVLTVLFPAETIEGILGLPTTYAYGLLLILGSIGCLWGITVPNYRIELYFLWAVTLGYLLYDIALWGLFAERVGVHDGLPPPYGPALGILVLTLFLSAKIMLLYRKNSQLIKVSRNARVD